MAKRITCSPEQIITKLREAEVYLSQGKIVSQACKSLQISEQTYYRWRREYREWISPRPGSSKKWKKKIHS